jgi:hypothetical protein
LIVALACTVVLPSLYAGYCDDCCYSADVEVGWRRDRLDWKVDRLHSSYISGHVNDKMHFKDLNSYTITGQAKWCSSCFYARLSGEYGFSYKGRADERFDIKSPYLYYPIGVDTSDPIRRRSEVYDFDGAIGYPFAFFCCRLSVIPLIGFSYHRQHLRVKDKNSHSSHDSSSSSDYSSSSSSRSSSSFFRSHSSKDFFVESSNPFRYSPSSDPFESPSSSDRNIASELGLSNPHKTSNYRFTWYGFYLGADIAYALDGCWSLFWNTEFHFFDNCHRKRKSWTGVYFVDDYHKKSCAYGFNNTMGLSYYIANCWFTTICVDFNWWKAHAKHDDLYWKKVGVKIGLDYTF